MRITAKHGCVFLNGGRTCYVVVAGGLCPRRPPSRVYFPRTPVSLCGDANGTTDVPILAFVRIPDGSVDVRSIRHLKHD